jgi:uncharacterized protein YndB with AHSA1/START domain
MPRVVTRAIIARSPEEVFAYVTTPDHWPAWHPSSLGVAGETDHSLTVGEEVTESFLVAGRRGKAVWTVRGREEPRRWVIFGQVEGSGTGTITYRLTPQEGGTAFEREFTYEMNNPILALLERLVLRRRIDAESTEAVRRLKERLEAETLPLEGRGTIHG